MHRDTSNPLLPSLTADLLNQPGLKLDNLFHTMWQRLGVTTLLKRCGFTKRSGHSVEQVVYLLMLWVWLKVDSIAMFARESLQSFSAAKKDALYDLLNREELNWRRLQLLIAKKVINETEEGSVRAFVVDDSVKMRRGKTMPGVSSHFDHLTGRCVMGQQVLTLGLATENQFVPLDSEIFISKAKAQPLKKPFSDGRSIVATRYQKAQKQTKPEMVRDMVSRALRAGVDAQYFLADAWFATKPMLRMTEEKLLTSIVRMKKGKMKYRLSKAGDGECIDLDAKQLYQQHIKGKWRKVSNQPYQSKSIEVELNLAQSETEEDNWLKVKLLFVRGVNAEKQQAGKNDWALFLSTDSQLTDERMLELYALRWGVEVYFKEAKQHLGLLKEQSTHYGTYIASIHLTAIRYCLLLYGKHEEGAERLSQLRSDMERNMCTLDFASRLWGLFRALIAGALDELKPALGGLAEDIMSRIEDTVTSFFKQAMQLDSFTLRLEARADKGSG